MYKKNRMLFIVYLLILHFAFTEIKESLRIHNKGIEKIENELNYLKYIILKKLFEEASKRGRRLGFCGELP